jgi:N-acyl-D-aspartate/D-glutamate deacylase
MNDLLIRGATVYDGTGSPGRVADVAVKDGHFAPPGPARDTLDAEGLALMPGIVDVHTHYDAQVTWDPTLSPSVSLGVTTAVMGNCGFGIAPCPAPLRETMVRNLSVVEGMDLEALLKGTRWEFETFAQYLDALERAHPYANVAVLAQHSTIRTVVMGEGASTRKAPTAEELARMRALVREALDAGAAGFASSFSPNHSGWGGQPMPSTIATDDELKVRHLRHGHRSARHTGVHGRNLGGDRLPGVHGDGAHHVQPRGARTRPDLLRTVRGGERARARGLHPHQLPAAFLRLHARGALSPLLARCLRSREGGSA